MLIRLAFVGLFIFVLAWAQSEISSYPISNSAVANASGFMSKAETVAAFIPATCSAPLPCSYSTLWGVAGERWKADGRLPDFSYAGYHAGEAKIPSPPARWNLKRDFHARGDGRTDDSLALRTAIQKIESGVLFIPSGTYVISRRIDISRGNLILRGAGPHQT